MGRTTRWFRSLLGGKKESKANKDDGGGDERREKQRWSFKSARESADTESNRIREREDNAAWLRTVYWESEKQQSKHAIAVATATAAAADAAVAAAKAAVAVVRLTSQGKTNRNQERLAAVKIQTNFRGFLAKKALRALKALVKLQALVRGYLVRKQAAATLYSMQALIRAQATVKAQKCRWVQPEIVPRKSIENMASAHSGRPESGSGGYDRSPKIEDIDTCRSKSRSSLSRTSVSLLDSAEDTTINSLSSPSPCRVPAWITIPDCCNFQDYDWCHRFASTTQSTPRYVSCATPTKSVSAAADGVLRRFLSAANCPNYASNTQSFEAKVRPQSAPKQRPEPPAVSRKRLPLSEVLLESRASLSGVGMQRSCTRVQEAFNFKSAVVDRLDRSVELGREFEQDFYWQRKW